MIFPKLFTVFVSIIAISCVISFGAANDPELLSQSFPTTLSSLKFLTNAQSLNSSERQFIIKAAAESFESIHPYITLIKSLRRTNPARRLQEFSKTANTLSPFDFHVGMRRIFQRVNDKHTTYFAPSPLRFAVAQLPFATRLYYETPKGGKAYIGAYGGDAAGIPTGARIIAVNGEQALSLAKRLGRAAYAPTEASILANGAPTIAKRYLALDEFPRLETANVKFERMDGSIGRVQLSWTVRSLTNPTLLGLFTRMSAHHEKGVDSDEISVALTPQDVFSNVGDPMLFHSSRAASDDTVKNVPVAPALAPFISASIHQTDSGPLGVLKFQTQGFIVTPLLMAEFVRILTTLPATSLMIDVRETLGGYPDFSKALTELFSNASVPTSGTQVRTSDLLGSMLSSKPADLIGANLVRWFSGPYIDAKRAGEFLTGPSADLYAPFGRRTPQQKQVYFGKVASVISGLTFSSGEVFAGLQQDLGASLVIGVDENTSGGGCASLSYSTIQKSFPDVFKKKMPGGVDFTTCFARFFRTGANTGRFIEQYGITPDIRYYPSRKDVYSADKDLYNFVAQTLSTK